MDKAKIKNILILAGVVSILATGIIHLIDAPDSFGDAPYKGWLFYVNFVGALVSAVGILLNRRIWGWNLGFIIAALSVLGYIASRTVGLPFIPAEPDEWLEPLGVASLIAEGLFIAVFAARRSLGEKI
jgi:hypothetical protein